MTLDRMEILRLALASAKDAREALTLAQEMAAFVAGSTPAAPQPVQIAAPEPTRAAKVIDTTNSRARKAWSPSEKERVAAMLDAGASYAAAGKVVGRSARAVQAIRSTGDLPVKKHTMSDVRRLSGALGAVAQGFKVDQAAFIHQPNGKAP
jgi:hypothetical protein